MTSKETEDPTISAMLLANLPQLFAHPPGGQCTPTASLATAPHAMLEVQATDILGNQSTLAPPSATPTHAAPVLKGAKESLRRKLLRKNPGIQLDNEPKTKKDVLTPAEVIKKERRKDQNRRAAQKCRLKKKLQQGEVWKKNDNLKQKNRNLNEKIQQLTLFLHQMQYFLMNHSCKLQQEDTGLGLNTSDQAVQNSSIPVQSVLSDSANIQLRLPLNTAQVVYQHVLTPELKHIQHQSLCQQQEARVPAQTMAAPLENRQPSDPSGFMPVAESACNPRPLSSTCPTFSTQLAAGTHVFKQDSGTDIFSQPAGTDIFSQAGQHIQVKHENGADDNDLDLPGFPFSTRRKRHSSFAPGGSKQKLQQQTSGKRSSGMEVSATATYPHSASTPASAFLTSSLEEPCSSSTGNAPALSKAASDGWTRNFFGIAESLSLAPSSSSSSRDAGHIPSSSLCSNFLKQEHSLLSTSPFSLMPQVLSGCRQTQDLPGCSQTQDLPGCSQTQDLPGCSQTQDLPGCSQTQDLPGCSQSIAESLLTPGISNGLGQFYSPLMSDCSLPDIPCLTSLDFMDDDTMFNSSQE